jgi:hypothetical protein
MRQIAPVLLLTLFLVPLARASGAQTDVQKQAELPEPAELPKAAEPPKPAELQKRVDELTKRIQQLEGEQSHPVAEVHQNAGGAVFFLFGVFCALWAQNTRRNPWLWFFLGVFFNVITVLMLLAKNSADTKIARGEPVATGSRVAFVVVVAMVIAVGIAVGAIFGFFWR